MIDLLGLDFWKEHNKSTLFLLPLTGLSKSQKYDISSYLFWGEYTIEDYNLMLRVKYDNYEEFKSYAKRVIFPMLDRNGYLIESYDFEGETVFVLDISEWALDIEMFLKGKYSKFSKEAKEAIKKHHTFYSNGPKVEIPITAALEPLDKKEMFDKRTAIQYIADEYNLDIKLLRKVGEAVAIYDKKKETLGLQQEDI